MTTNGTSVAHADMDVMLALREVERLADKLMRQNEKMLAAIKLVAYCRDCAVCRGVAEVTLRELAATTPPEGT